MTKELNKKNSLKDLISLSCTIKNKNSYKKSTILSTLIVNNNRCKNQQNYVDTRERCQKNYSTNEKN